MTILLLPFQFGYFLFYALCFWVSFLFYNFLFYIGVWLIYNVVLVSGVQQSHSVIHIHVSILFQILFPFVFSFDGRNQSKMTTMIPEIKRGR